MEFVALIVLASVFMLCYVAYNIALMVVTAWRDNAELRASIDRRALDLDEQDAREGKDGPVGQFRHDDDYNLN